MKAYPLNINNNMILFYDDDIWSIKDTNGDCIIPFADDIVAVLNDIITVFGLYFGNKYMNTIKVLILTRKDYPQSFKKHNIIFLSARGRNWKEYAYQFAHELCHLTIPSNVAQPFRWFEESICELASIFFLYEIAKKWAIDPPYSNWKEYAPYFLVYANDVIKTSELPPADSSFAKFFYDNLTFLSKECYQRDINCLCAKQLLPIFLESPMLWADVPYLSALPGNIDFYSALSKWQELSNQKLAIGKIIELFKIN